MDQHLAQSLAPAISKSFSELLSERHLYQSIKVDLSFVPRMAERLHNELQKKGRIIPKLGRATPPAPRIPTPQDIQRQLEAQMNVHWVPIAPGRPETAGGFEFRLPTIHTTCPDSACEGLWPFDPVLSEISVLRSGLVEQILLLPYLCQSCKRGKITYLVRRSQEKLKLVGRDPMEVVKTPKNLPDRESRYFSDAVVAYNSGQTLAGTFLLRVFIEQHWLSVLGKAQRGNGRPSREELGGQYKKLLPPAFRSAMPTLVDTYASL